MIGGSWVLVALLTGAPQVAPGLPLPEPQEDAEETKEVAAPGSGPGGFLIGFAIGGGRFHRRHGVHGGFHLVLTAGNRAVDEASAHLLMKWGDVRGWRSTMTATLAVDHAGAHRQGGPLEP